MGRSSRKRGVRRGARAKPAHRAPGASEAQGIERPVDGGDGRAAALPGQARAGGEDGVRRAELQALERFADRRVLDELRDALLDDVSLGRSAAGYVAGWLEDAEDWGEPDRESLFRLALEHALLVGEESEDDADSPLGRLAEDPATPPGLAAAARRWQEHCVYGLWQVADPTPRPGIWLTDVLSGARRYVAVPVEQLGSLARWSVLLGALVACDGTWRTGGAVVPLRPCEADRLGDLVHEMAHVVMDALPGRRARTKTPAPWRGAPHGVLVGITGAVPPEVADLFSTIVGDALPRLVDETRAWRSDAPTLTNTDSDPVCIITASVAVSEPGRTAGRLAAHQDFERDGDVLVWWGRELDATERATALAKLRARLAEEGEALDLHEDEGPQRWLQGRIRADHDPLEVEVNSRERLVRFLDLLRELGEEPQVVRQGVFDPAQHLPQQRGTPMPFGASQETFLAWLQHWPDHPVAAPARRAPPNA